LAIYEYLAHHALFRNSFRENALKHVPKRTAFKRCGLV